MHGDPQLTRQHRQRVAINARDDAASQVPHRYHAPPLAAQQSIVAKTSHFGAGKDDNNDNRTCGVQRDHLTNASMQTMRMPMTEAEIAPAFEG